MSPPNYRVEDCFTRLESMDVLGDDAQRMTRAGVDRHPQEEEKVGMSQTRQQTHLLQQVPVYLSGLL